MDLLELAAVFLLLGLELLLVPVDLRLAGLWGCAIALVPLARILVALPWGGFFRARHVEKDASLLLTGGGLRGALSLALALSIPAGPARGVVLSMTFAVVLVSVLVQGLTFGRLAGWVERRRLTGPRYSRRSLRPGKIGQRRSASMSCAQVQLVAVVDQGGSGAAA